MVPIERAQAHLAGAKKPPTLGDSSEAERLLRREAERHSGMIPNAIGA